MEARHVAFWNIFGVKVDDVRYKMITRKYVKGIDGFVMFHFCVSSILYMESLLPQTELQEFQLGNEHVNVQILMITLFLEWLHPLLDVIVFEKFIICFEENF